jgi:hypothetical protein
MGCFFFWALVLLGTVQPAAAGLAVWQDAGGLLAVPVSSIKARRFAGLSRQQYDFSCGSAALSTLLTYHYRDPVDEMTVFKQMYEQGQKEKIKAEGFSLLDMKKFLESRGYQADGYRVTLEKLLQAGIPAITLVNEDGYRHFVVVKGVDRTHVLLGDPAKGLKIVDRTKFSGMWNGILFVIRTRSAVAEEHFNRQDEWRRVAQAPLNEVIPLGSSAGFTLQLPPSHDF